MNPIKGRRRLNYSTNKMTKCMKLAFRRLVPVTVHMSNRNDWITTRIKHRKASSMKKKVETKVLRNISSTDNSKTPVPLKRPCFHNVGVPSI